MQRKTWVLSAAVALFLVTSVEGGALPIATVVLRKWTISPTETSSSIKESNLYLSLPKPIPSYAVSSRLPILKRRKRVAAATIFAGLSALGGLLSGSGTVTNTILTHQKSGGGSNSPQYERQLLPSIENRLTGIEGKIKNVALAVLERQAETKITSQIIQNLIIKDGENSQRNFEVTRGLISQGILENRFNSAAIQGLITKRNAENERNFAKVQVSIRDLKDFVNQEISSAKADIRKGFESISDLLEKARIEPLVSKMLTQITEFHHRLNHVHGLPEQNKKDEIGRSGGFISYLESSPLQGDLYDIIHQNLAVPKDATDVQAIFILDLLVNGIQVHARMLSAIVSSNVYLARKALEESKLEDFNLYMSRIRSSTERLKTALGCNGNQGLLQKVKEAIDKVHNLPYISNIRGARQLISDQRILLDQVDSDILSLITDNTELNDPGTIIGKISFMSQVSTPIGPWQDNKKVTYAIQLVSENGLSKVGEWSTPYTVQNKAFPIIMLPSVEDGLVRLVYRRFNDENPELVAVLDDHTQAIVRDIGRDLLNAAAKPNEDISVEETTRLLNNGADANIWIEKNMTPLHYAAKHGNVKVMKLLVERGADVNAKSSDNEQPLHFAALFGTDEGIEYLISKGANINAQTKALGLSALHIAVANNHVDAVKILLRKNAFINMKDNYGLTPLHISIAGNGETMDVLLESATLDVNIAAEDGLTPLHYAARSTNEVFVRNLLRHNDANVNILTDSQVSPLHFAAMSSNALVIAELIQKGASVSARDEDGSTPLHYAAFYGNKDAVLTLLQVDQSLTKIKNNNDKTPHDFALENNWQFVAEALLSDFDKLVEIIRTEMTEQADNPTEVTSVNDSSRENTLVQNSPIQETPINCTKNLGNELAKGTDETCAKIGNVERYVNLVMSMIPLEVNYTNNEFSQIFKDYDQKLGVAQTHAKIWRNGDSIIKGIRQTFELAREFEPEFKRKNKINKDRVKKITENVDKYKLINKTKAEITKLVEKLEEATEVATEVVKPSAIEYFRKRIPELQEELNEKRRILREDFTLIQELEELIDFLEFVRSDSTKIADVASNTKKKVETFKINLMHDKSAFVRHSQIAGEAFDKLRNKTIEKDRKLAELQQNEVELKKQIETERAKTSALYAQIEESHSELRQIRRDIMDRMKKTSTMKIIGYALIPFFVGLISIPLLVVANEQEKGLIQQLEAGMDSNRGEIDLLNAQIKHRYAEIDRMQQLIANSSSNSDKVKHEMNVFIHVKRDLQDLSSDVQKLLEAIEKAIVGIQIIKDVFDDVTKKLTEMIDLAIRAKTEAERLNAKYFIYHNINTIECNWNDVSIKVMDIDTCTKTFEILN